MTDQELHEIFERERDSVLAAAVNAAKKRTNPDEKPSRLYHFTDVGGLIGVLSNATLWASLATSLNDAQEIKYCSSVALQVCANGVPGVSQEFLSGVQCAIADPAWEQERFDFTFDAYVTSFCVRDDSALQWLHYGRSGSGVAICFKPECLSTPPFDLVQVLYEPHDQRVFIETFLREVDSALRKSLPAIPEGAQEYFVKMTAHMSSRLLGAMGSQMKAPAFRGEEEWRLVTLGGRKTNALVVGDVPLTTSFRSVGTRVVPYVKVPLALDASISGVVLGNVAAMEPDEEALKILYLGTAGRIIPTSRSAVRVRT